MKQLIEGKSEEDQNILLNRVNTGAHIHSKYLSYKPCILKYHHKTLRENLVTEPLGIKGIFKLFNTTLYFQSLLMKKIPNRRLGWGVTLANNAVKTLQSCIYAYDGCKGTWPIPYSYQSNWLKNWNILYQQPKPVQCFWHSWPGTVASLLMNLVDPLTKHCSASFAQPGGYCRYCLSIGDFRWISKRKNSNLITCGSSSFK